MEEESGNKRCNLEEEETKDGKKCKSLKSETYVNNSTRSILGVNVNIHRDDVIES